MISTNLKNKSVKRSRPKVSTGMSYEIEVFSDNSTSPMLTTFIMSKTRN